jgi:hypothetical protein
MPRPRHPNKHIEAALRYAEAKGWRYHAAGHSAHAWGRLLCRAGHVEHQFSVWSTPRNPEGHAKHIRRMVDRCEHSAGDIAEEES